MPPGTNSQLPTESFGCQFCSRSFKNQRGFSQHLRCCRRVKQGNIYNLNSNNNENFQGSLVTSSCSDFVQNLTVNLNDFANVQPSTKPSNDALATRTQSSSSIQPESTYNQRTFCLFFIICLSRKLENLMIVLTHIHVVRQWPKNVGNPLQEGRSNGHFCHLRRNCVLEEKNIYASYKFSRKEIYCRDDSSYQCLE